MVANRGRISVDNGPTGKLPFLHMKKLQQRFLFRSVSILLIVFPVLSLLYSGANQSGREVQAAQRSLPATNEIAVLRADIERLKGMVLDQSHAMKDVAYHFTNLWFAGEKKNWPLADFYWSETRSHLHWAVRIIPVRKDPKGNETRLAEILDPIERTALEDVHKAINEKSGENSPTLTSRCWKVVMRVLLRWASRS